MLASVAMSLTDYVHSVYGSCYHDLAGLPSFFSYCWSRQSQGFVTIWRPYLPTFYLITPVSDFDAYNCRYQQIDRIVNSTAAEIA